MAKGDLISRSELLKEFDPNKNRLDPIFVRSRIVQAKSISDAEIRAKAIEEFANWLVDNNMLVAKEDNMRTVSDVVKAFNEQLKGGAVDE